MNCSTPRLRRLCGALAISTLFFTLVAAAQAQAVPGQGTWETALQPRDLDNNGSVDAWYDTQLDITWLADANLNGQLTWGDAVSWAAGLNLGGSPGWRLPKQSDFANGCNDSFNGTNCGFNVDTTQTELGALFYVTLGNFAAVDTFGAIQPSGYGITNAGPFINLQSDAYWTGQPDTVGNGIPGDTCEQADTCAYFFDFGFGAQQIENKTNTFYAMAVHAGDVGVVPSPVPEPGSWALLLAGLGLTVGLARRRSRAAAVAG